MAELASDALIGDLRQPLALAFGRPRRDDDGGDGGRPAAETVLFSGHVAEVPNEAPPWLPAESHR